MRRGLVLLITSATLLTGAQALAGARALVVSAPTPSSMALATTRVRNMLILRGLQVDVVDAVPADPAAYCCIWDLRFETTLTVDEMAVYLDFLIDGHGLVLIGENPDCCRARNSSIDTFLRTRADGGNVRISDINEIAGTSVEFVNAGHSIANDPTPIVDVTYDGSGAGVFQSLGRGAWLTTRLPGPRNVASVWNQGAMLAAPGGRVVVINDLNWLVETFGQTDNQPFLDNLGNFACPSVDASLLVSIATPGGFVRECPASLTVAGRVDGADAVCVQATTLGGGGATASVPVLEFEGAGADAALPGGPEVTEIAASVNGGPFVPVSTTTPPLPAPPPIDFVASNLPLALGPNVIVVRARDGGTREDSASISGDLRDSIAPTIDPSTCQDVAIALDSTCSAQYGGVPIASDGCDPLPAMSTSPALPVSFAAPGMQDILYTVTDDSGNKSSCTRSLTAEDRTAPVLVCVAPRSIECSAAGGTLATDSTVTAWLAGTTVTENCSLVSLANDAPVLFPSSCAPGRPTEVSWNAVDASANSASCASILTVRDSLAPVITSTPSPVALECNVAGGVRAGDPAVTAWRATFAGADVCGTATASDDVPALLPAGCAPGKVTPVTFIARDGCGNEAKVVRTATVIDSTPPVLGVPAPLRLECSSPGGVLRTRPELVAWLASATAADLCGGSIVTNDAPPLIPAGCSPGRVTPVTVTAIDECGNSNLKAASVTVVDSAAPVLSTPPPLALECSVTGGVPRADPRVQSWLGLALANDVCGTAAVTNDVPAMLPAGCGKGVLTPVQFSGSDACSNATTGGTSVTVRDSTAPVLRVPVSITLECSSPSGIPRSDPAIQAWLASASAADTCHGVSIAHDAPVLFPSGCGTGAVTLVTFRATDDCGNVSLGTATIAVRDTTEPALVVPPPTTFECMERGGTSRSDPEVQAWLASAGASDICDGATIAHDAPAFLPSGCAPGKVTVVTFTATDNCRNAAAGAVPVSVADTTPPTIGAIAFDGICLWPPNHHFYCIDDVASDVIAVDLCDARDPGIRVESCRSSQPPEGNGDGRSEPDCIIRDGGRGVCLRAERDGSEPLERLYSLEISATDGCANASIRSVIVRVPHDADPGDACRRPNRGREL